jgi:phage FluMu gp28-like protein
MARSNKNKNKNGDKNASQELKFNDFKRLKKLSAYLIQNRTRDSMNCKVQWLKIKRMRYEKDKPNIIIFSYDQDSEYR